MIPLEDLVKQVKSKKHELDTLQAQITKQFQGNLPAPIAEVLLDLPEDCPGWGQYHPTRTLCLVCTYNIPCMTDCSCRNPQAAQIDVRDWFPPFLHRGREPASTRGTTREVAQWHGNSEDDSNSIIAAERSKAVSSESIMVEGSRHTRWHRKMLEDEHSESTHRQKSNVSKGSIPT